MAPSFQTKKGWLTRYALGCGYAEVKEIDLGPGTQEYAGVRLDMAPATNVLFVWGIGQAKGLVKDWSGTNLKEARRVYAKAWREVKARFGKPQS